MLNFESEKREKNNCVHKKYNIYKKRYYDTMNL